MSLRWGIVTAGKISNDFVNALNSYPDKGDQAIVAIAARNKNRATEFAKIHNIEKVFNSYEELAKSNDIDYSSLSHFCDKILLSRQNDGKHLRMLKIDIGYRLSSESFLISSNKFLQSLHTYGLCSTDVVYIGALNPDHYTLTKLFLDNGKHVLCEKPFCLNYKQAQSLINLAKKRNLFVMEAIWTRFSPAYVDLEKEISSDNLGDVKFVEANFGICADAERLSKKELGGGALLDIGIYLLHLAQFVFKEEPSKVHSVGKLMETGVDQSETIILEYGSGKRAVLNADSRLVLWNQATVYGSKGRVTLEDPFHFPQKIILNGNIKEYVSHSSTLPYNFPNSAGLAYQAVEVARCIKAGLLESPRMPHKDTLMLAKLMDTIRTQLGVHYDADDQEYGL